MIKKRRYNKRLYKFWKQTNRLTRNKFAPNPFDKLKKYGFIGNFFGKIGNRIVNPIINHASYSTVSCFYNQKKDSPFKGSFLYTGFYFFYSLLILGVVSLILYMIIL